MKCLESIVERRRSAQLLLAVCVLVSLASGLTGQPVLAADGPPSFAGQADQVKHTVVNISTTQVVRGQPLHPFGGPDSPFRDFFGDDMFKRFFGDMPERERETHALGSGVVISKDGFILTNNHVVEKATEIKVKLQSGKEYDAKVVGADPKTDLALIKAEPDSDFPEPARLGDSDGIRVGDWVMAVGNPFGLGHTTTVGIISAKGRIIGAGPYDDFLQTDAAINPGNSGGPLFNMKKEVVGINTAIVAQGQGIGFAIPINVAKALLPQLKAGEIIRGWLGIMIQDVTPDLAKSFDLKEAKGVLISDVVADAPADKSGLERGDVVMQFDGKEVENSHVLSRMVAATPPKTAVTVGIVRKGEEKDIKVTVGTMPAKPEEEPELEKSAWGLTVQTLTSQLAERLGLDPDETGVVVTDVAPGSPADEAGMQRGDVVQEVNRWPVKDAGDYAGAIDKAGPDKEMLLLVRRAGGTRYVILQPTSKE